MSNKKEKIVYSPQNRMGRPQMLRVQGTTQPCDCCGVEDTWMLNFQYGSHIEKMYEIWLCNTCEGWQLRSHLQSYLQLTKSKEVPEMGYSSSLAIP
jgi:hypothetical protein